MPNYQDINDPIYQTNKYWLRPGESRDQWNARTGYNDIIAGTNNTQSSGSAPAGGPPTVNRYTQPGYITNLDVTAPDQAAIQAAERARIQAQVDATNQVYNDMVTNIGKQGEVNLGGTRSINARAGLVGSDFETANIEGTKKATKESVDQTNNLRMQQVQALWDKADQRALEIYNSKKTEVLNNQKTVYEDQVRRQEEAQSDLGKLAAASRFKFSDLDPKDRQLWEEQTGLNEVMATALWNQSLPESMRPVTSSSSYRGDNGNMWSTTSTFDPANPTAKPVVTKWDTGIPFSDELDIKEGGDGYFYTYDSKTGTMRRIGGSGPKPSDTNGGPWSPQESKTMNWINTTLNPETGLLSVSNYDTIRADWIANGFKGLDFDKKFDAYNPRKHEVSAPTDSDEITSLIDKAVEAISHSVDSVYTYTNAKADFLKSFPGAGDVFDAGIKKNLVKIPGQKEE